MALKGPRLLLVSEATIAAELVERISQGDRSAEGELIERYSRGLLYMLRRTTGDSALAEDIHQETFRIVLLRLRERSLDDPRSLSPFLRRTARNLFIDDYRKRSRRRTDNLGERIPDVKHPGPSPLHRVMSRERGEVVRKLLEELRSTRDRELLRRYYLAEEEKQQICDEMGLESRHFDRVLFRARQRFKNLFRRYEKRAALRVVAYSGNRERSGRGKEKGQALN